MNGDRMLKQLARAGKPLTCNAIVRAAGLVRAGSCEYAVVAQLKLDGLIRLAHTRGKRQHWELTQQGMQRAEELLAATPPPPQ